MLSAMSGSSSMMSINGFINGGCGSGVGSGRAGERESGRARDEERYFFPPLPHSLAPALSRSPTPHSLPCYLTMFDHQSFGHVNNQLADVGDVISDALEVFGDQQQPGGAPGRRRVARHPVEQVVKDAVVETVDVVAALDNRPRGL